MGRQRLALGLTLVMLAAPGTAAGEEKPPGTPDMSADQARAALAGPGARGAAVRGQARGVRARTGRDGVVVSFSGPGRALFRRAVAGRRVQVTCVRLGHEALGLSVTREDGFFFRAPRSRPTLRTGLSGRYDYCEVIRPASTRRPRRNVTVKLSPAILAAVALTERGTTFLDERERARSLFALVSLAGFTADRREQGTYPKSAPFVKKIGGPLVALDDPLATPPKGKLGYFSDGERHIAAVTLSDAGRRLFIEYNDDVIATNVLEYLND